MYKLTAERRYQVCIHEAAHAVIHAIGGAFIYRLAVAPVGCTEWTTESRKGGSVDGLWGICSPSDTSAMFSLKWDDENGHYLADKDGFEKIYCRTNRRFLPKVHREIRAHICAGLAGPIADLIQDGESDIWLEPAWEGDCRGADTTVAFGLSLLLPWRNEYDSLTAVTEQTLRRPDVWAMVVNLARELERVGDMEDFDGFLPDAVAGWPSSPRAKKPVVVSALTISK